MAYLTHGGICEVQCTEPGAVFLPENDARHGLIVSNNGAVGNVLVGFGLAPANLLTLAPGQALTLELNPPSDALFLAGTGTAAYCSW